MDSLKNSIELRFGLFETLSEREIDLIARKRVAEEIVSISRGRKIVISWNYKLDRTKNVLTIEIEWEPKAAAERKDSVLDEILGILA